MDMPSYLTEPEIGILRDAIDPGVMQSRIELYAGPQMSRHIDHSGNAYAAHELYLELGRVGAPLQVSKLPFTLGSRTLHNVEAILPGAMRGGTLAISAHLDSTAEGTVGFRREIHPAPGADDDASGVAGVLLAARAMLRLAQAYPTVPRREIRFVLFNAEEREQVGSRKYVRAVRASGMNLLGAYQMDMIAYATAGQKAFEIHAGCPNTPYVEEASVKLAQVIVEVCPAVSPGLTPQIHLDTAKEADSSDHASFHGAAYPACLVSEDSHPGHGGPGHVNPARHKADDVLDLSKLNMEYAAGIARAVAAATWFAATR